MVVVAEGLMIGIALPHLLGTLANPNQRKPPPMLCDDAMVLHRLSGNCLVSTGRFLMLCFGKLDYDPRTKEKKKVVESDQKIGFW
jgi:hypothetical protein